MSFKSWDWGDAENFETVWEDFSIHGEVFSVSVMKYCVALLAMESN